MISNIFKCKLKINYIIKALKCIIDNPCKNNGDCVDLSGGEFSCTCKKGFTGADCGIGNFHTKPHV